MKISVLISVYREDAAPHLDDALYSIWEGQELKPNQIVLVKDGPLTEELDVVVEKWRRGIGHHMEVVELQENVGLGKALNYGLLHCKYELVARMDADDISLPERFSRQLQFMRDNEEVVASSAGLEEWDEDMSLKIGERVLPQDYRSLLSFSKRRSPLNHPVTMFRKSVVDENGGYPELRKAQDYALWSLLLSKGYILKNAPEVLLKMRAGSGLLERRKFNYLKHEYELLKFQRNIGFLRSRDFFVNLVLRSIVRISPSAVKRYLYRKFR